MKIVAAIVGFVGVLTMARWVRKQVSTRLLSKVETRPRSSTRDTFSHGICRYRRNRLSSGSCSRWI